MHEPMDIPVLSEAPPSPVSSARPPPVVKQEAPKPAFDIPTLVFLIATSTVLGGFLGYMLSSMENHSVYADIQSQIENMQQADQLQIKVIDVVSISTKNPKVKPEILGQSITSTAEELSKQGYLVLLGSQVYKVPDSIVITDVEIKEQ